MCRKVGGAADVLTAVTVGTEVSPKTPCEQV